MYAGVILMQRRRPRPPDNEQVQQDTDCVRRRVKQCCYRGRASETVSQISK